MAVYIEVYASFGAFNFKIALSVPCGTRRFSSTQTHTPEFCDPQKYLIRFLQLFLLRKKTSLLLAAYWRPGGVAPPKILSKIQAFWWC
jgi:hypothetical protein